MLNYLPYYLNSVQAVLETHSSALSSLLGKSLTDSWVVWEQNEDEWFNDAPVVLNFEGVHLELNFFKLDELSITFDTLDLHQKPDWYGLTNFDLIWRKDVLKELVDVKGFYLERMTVTEYLFETEVMENRTYPELVGQKNAAWLLSGLSFWFGDSKFVTVHNGLDENAVSAEQPKGYNFREHPITVER